MKFRSARNLYLKLKYYTRFLLLLSLAHSLPAFSQDEILRFVHLTVEDGLPQNLINGIVKDKYGFMWFGTWGGLCKYDGYKFTLYKNDIHNPHTINHNRVHLVLKDSVENIWVLTFDSSVFCKYNYETDDFTRIPRKKAPKYILDSLNRNRNISHTHVHNKDYKWDLDRINWLLHQTNLHTGKQRTYLTNPLNRWALSDDETTDLYLDDNNILWIGTINGGINKADIGIKPFTYYYHSLKNDCCIIDNHIRTIFEKNNIIWVGTRSKGITKINRNNNTYTHYQHQDKNVNTLIDNKVRKIYADNCGYMWFGTKSGLDRYDPVNNHFYHYTKQNGKISSNWIYVITEDHLGNLWIGTWDGIARYNRKTDSFVWYSLDFLHIHNPAIRVIVEDKKDNLWISVEGNGIFKLNRKLAGNLDETLTLKDHFEFSASDKNSISDNLIYTLIEDENGMMWAGSSNGLNRIDPISRKITRISEKNGLPDMNIVGLVSNLNGYLWISHKKGISKLNTKTLVVRNFTEQDGLQGIEFSEDAYFRDKITGELFFGGTNGFNTFFPDSIKENDPYLPKIVLTDLKIANQSVPIQKKFNGRIVLSASITLTKEITLTHFDKNITIEFAGLHYSNPKSNKYQHMLEGFDQEWINSDASVRFANYSNLSPGTYFFKVKASNGDGYWNPTPAILKIVVLAPWWKTWWFKLLLALFIAAILLLLFYSRVISYQKRQRELTYLVKLRTQELETMNQQLLSNKSFIEEQSETLKIANASLLGQHARLEEYAEEMITQNEKLQGANEKLIEHQSRIEEQSEELRTRGENLKTVNEVLLQKQKLIQLQAKKLEDTNKELLTLNSTKDRFFSIIAHDLRNPFHVVAGFSEILLSQYKDLSAEKMERYLSLINISATNGNNLLENLLQWSRSQTGRISFESIDLNLRSLVEENIRLLEGDAQRKGINFQCDIEHQIMVVADMNMLNTIFRNLFSNAIKFTRENGSISVKATKKRLLVEIMVSDTGIGIDPRQMSSLFNIDTNVSTPGTSNESGTGLGLLLCKEFVARHGGKIWVESEVGKGTTFFFTLLGSDIKEERLEAS
jgi:signal transduction histidine kinase/ligand-binding sensor domain-containing protein